MSSETTTTHNVYRVTFSQHSSPDHEAIALVPAQNANQGAGRFYHVKGAVRLGMDYEVIKAHRFAEVEGFKGAVLRFQIRREDLGRFEEITERVSASA